MSTSQLPNEPMTAVQQLMGILWPNANAEIEKLKNGQSQLVHYTTAENALNIVKSGRFWLRNVRCMNDYLEVQHGINLLLKAFGGPDNVRIARLYRALDQISEGEAKEGIDTFNKWLPRLPNSTFIGCLSQADLSETSGRLSMWRAYSSPNAGVALVLNKAPFVADTNILKAYSMPVAYLSDEEFVSGIDNCLTQLEYIAPDLRGFDSGIIRDTIFWWLCCMAVSLKHPAFDEEREWRIVYFPEMAKSNVIEEHVECVRGVPQIVQQIPLLNDPDKGLHEASPDKLIEKIIIGPSQFPLVVADAFSAVLGEVGVNNAFDRISISFIPLR